MASIRRAACTPALVGIPESTATIFDDDGPAALRNYLMPLALVSWFFVPALAQRPASAKCPVSPLMLRISTIGQAIRQSCP